MARFASCRSDLALCLGPSHRLVRAQFMTTQNITQRIKAPSQIIIGKNQLARETDSTNAMS